MSQVLKTHTDSTLTTVFAKEAALLVHHCDAFLADTAQTPLTASSVSPILRILASLARISEDLENNSIQRLISELSELFQASVQLPEAQHTVVIETAREGLDLLSVILAQLAQGLPALGEATADGARVESFLDHVKNSRQSSSESLPQASGSPKVIVDPVFRTVRRSDGPPAILTPKEIQIISLLANAPRMTRPREDLVATVWAGTKCCSKNFGVHLTNLRKKIHPVGLGVRCTPPNEYSLVFLDTINASLGADLETSTEQEL